MSIAGMACSGSDSASGRAGGHPAYLADLLKAGVWFTILKANPPFNGGCVSMFKGSPLTLGQMADAILYVGGGAGVDTKAKPSG
jgi:hypothetical protein